MDASPQLTPKEIRRARGGNWIEISNAIILSVAALFTSWSSYQAALWDGEQAAHYSQANAGHTAATQARLEADILKAAEVDLFGRWLEAKVRGDTRLADFYEVRFPADMKVAFEAWRAERPLENPKASPTPFSNPAYHSAGAVRAAEYDRAADRMFQAGQRANLISDDFVQVTMFLAMAMFFGGIGQVFDLRTVRMLLLAIALVSCILGLARLIDLPLLRPG